MSKALKYSLFTVAAAVAALASVFASANSAMFFNKPEVPAELCK